jgi:anaerobic magnesium-protoporphyrin IX monomethyl ester cyclase
MTLGRKPKLLLVYPPITRMERYGSNLGLFGGRQIPLGLYSLAAYARREGYDAHALDAEALGLAPADICARLAQGSFDVLGISATTVAFHRAVELAQAVKAQLPRVSVVIGGPHVSSQPEQPLTFSSFDYAVRGEGELTLVALLELIERGGDPSAVPGLIHREDGRVKVNPKRPYVMDLDSLPHPAFDLIPDLDAYRPPPFNYRARPVANVITSRGCPNECTFCERTTFGRVARKRSAENIAAEIEELVVKRGAREIAFVDDTFTTWPGRVREIFERTRARGLSFPWTCMSRVDTVDRDLLAFMRDSGCWYVAFGVESGDQAILKRIKKNISLDDVRRVTGYCRELGIKTKGFFIIGHPGETVASIDATIDFACELPLDHVVVTINTPMPGSLQFEQAARYGDLELGDWKRYNYWNPVFVPFGLTRELMLAKQTEFLRRFYLRPGRIARSLAAFATGRTAWVQLAGFAADAARLGLNALRGETRR